MSAAAFALCGYKAEEAGPLQGALNFAVTNTVGAFLILCGIALLYGRTGALNLAQIGRALGDVRTAWCSPSSPSSAVRVSGEGRHRAVPLLAGRRARGGADPGLRAASPASWWSSGCTPWCGFTGPCFSGALAGSENELRNILAAFGAATALLGAVMCYAQRHLKRLLAFSTISHMGIVLLGISLLTPRGLAGAEIYGMGHALVKGGLFLAAGILLHRRATVDEIDLIGRCRHMRWTGGLFFLGAAGLAGAPPFGTFWGHAMMDSAGARLGYGWINWVTFAAAVITSPRCFAFPPGYFSGGVRRPRSFPQRERTLGKVPTRMADAVTRRPRCTRRPRSLIALGALAGLAPRLTGTAEAAAIHIQDRLAYAQRVLDMLTPYPAVVQDQPATAADTLRALGAVAAAALLAGVTLRSRGARKWMADFRPVRACSTGRYARPTAALFPTT